MHSRLEVNTSFVINVTRLWMDTNPLVRHCKRSFDILRSSVLSPLVATRLTGTRDAVEVRPSTATFLYTYICVIIIIIIIIIEGIICIFFSFTVLDYYSFAGTISRNHQRRYNIFSLSAGLLPSKIQGGSNMTGTDFFLIKKIFFIIMRCSTLRGTFCSLITLATPRQEWTGSNPSRREGGGCGFTLSRSHSCCAVRLFYTQISPGHIWTTLWLLMLWCSSLLKF